ncbi:hypothetical protein RRF57_004502 [Xylaria bambusicola]|uniref:Yippee domain-containing protein n=1 Tax=Xylaria bambusicola TaxID=326684 RepID=A0AAN7Z3X6_9PEZI
MLSMIPILSDVAPPPPPPPGAAVVNPPLFPTYLLPSLSRPFRRHRHAYASSSTDSNSSPTSTPAPSDVPSLRNSPTDSLLSSPVHGSPASSSFPLSLSRVTDGLRRRSVERHDAPKLTRTRPDTIRCSTCGTDFAFYSQVVSKGFTGRYGRAYLVSPPDDPSQEAGSSLMNIKVGKPESRMLSTGTHVVSDIQCAICRAKIGWKYIDAKAESQKYKIGKFILETRRTVTYASWEDAMVSDIPELEFENKGPQDGDDEELVVFDSSDEDECDDLFAGVWKAESAAEKRKLKLKRRFK